MAAAVLTIVACTAGVAFGAHDFNPGGPDSKVLAAATSSDQSSPLVDVSFPEDGRAYNLERWNHGCPGEIGICGTASDPFDVASVEVAIRRQSDGRYWNGSDFSARAATYIQAGGTTRWSFPFGLPADGKFMVSARVTNGLGAVSLGSEASAVFIADQTPPPAPTLTGDTGVETYDTTAGFSFTDEDPDAKFHCTLDGSEPGICESPVRLQDLPIGDHVFTVTAVDPAGNSSPPATFGWTILTHVKFTVTGDAAEPFVPGSSQPIDLRIWNPYKIDLKVTAVNVHIGPATTASGDPLPECRPENLVVEREFQGPVVVPAGSTRSLSDLGVSTRQWPVLAMPDLDTNQDACKHAVFPLTYTGTGTKS